MIINKISIFITLAIPIALNAAAKVDYDKELFELFIRLNERQKPDISAIKNVLNQKANVNAVDKAFFDKTPLHYASCLGFSDVVILLLQEGALIDTRTRERECWTALHCAAHQGKIAVVNELLKKGATIDIRDTNRSTPLHLAGFWLRDDIIKLLLESGSNYNLTNGKGETTLAIVKNSKFGDDKRARIVKLMQDYDLRRQLALDYIPQIILDLKLMSVPLARLITQYCYGFSEPKEIAQDRD